MISLKIKVTKDVLKATKNCGRYLSDNVTTNCAIAFAVRDIFPNARVYGSGELNFFGDAVSKGIYTSLPIKAHEYMNKFDVTESFERELLPELEFEINIPDEVIERINIEEIKPLLVNHPTLELLVN